MTKYEYLRPIGHDDAEYTLKHATNTNQQQSARYMLVNDPYSATEYLY